jgi:hypothetical protein
MKPLQKIEYEEWFAKYKPILNTIEANSSFDGFMFETYGEEVNTVRLKEDNLIWTMVDSDQTDGIILVPGYHFVNRIGYFITEIPWEHENIEVGIWLGEDNEDNEKEADA